MNNNAKLMMALCLAAAAATSCKDKEYFDQGVYEEIVGGAFPVAKVDPAHTWETVASATVRVTLKTNDKAIYTVRIYTGNPAAGRRAALLAAGRVPGQGLFETAVSLPATENTLYIALTGGDGHTRIYRRTTAGATLATEIGGADHIATMPEPPAEAERQSLRYCFEENFPEPGDFDFNDIVVSLSTETDEAGPYAMRLTVTLDAVGSLSQQAAALRLKGIARQQVLAAKTEGDDWFDFYNRTTASINLMDNGKLVTAARNGDAVIYLFNDAHWAMKPVKAADGSVARPYYNTHRGAIKPEDTFEAEDIAPRKCVITIMFDSEETARSICAANLDVFMIKQYNGGTWEIHTSPFKLDNALFDYSTAAYDNPYIWALLLPGGTPYAREAKPIGSFADSNTLGGAYQTFGHSFGEWARDRHKATDWYLFPEKNMVY